MRLLLLWVINALALAAIPYVVPSVTVSGFWTALIAALLLALVNTLIRPLLILLTLPLNIITLGLFTFVINALLFWFAANLLDGFQVRGFAAALLGSLIYSAFGVVIDSAIERLFFKQ